MDAVARLRLLCNFIATASPPASSDALTIRLPLERRCKLLLKRTLARFKFSDDLVAAKLELIVILILSSLTK